MRYVTELGKNPAVMTEFAFGSQYDTTILAKWCMENIFWLEDDGLFPPPIFIRHQNILHNRALREAKEREQNQTEETKPKEEGRDEKENGCQEKGREFQMAGYYQ